MSKRIFIISPYTHDNPNVMADRVIKAERYFVSLMEQGYIPVSVVVACHHLTLKYAIPQTYEYWKAYCESEIQTCDEVHALVLDGFDDSTGVVDEIGITIRHNKPITYIFPEDLV